MHTSIRTGFARAAIVAAGCIASAAAANVMTFDPLTPDFSAITSYSEDGINIASGNSNHFHTVSGDSGTAADFYESDAFPQTITFDDGPFTLTSIDFLSFTAGIQAVFTSSSGAVATFSTPGTKFFGPGFSDIDFVTISSLDGGSDNDLVLDNITINGAVPEPASWALMIGGFGIAGASLRRRRAVAA